MKHVVIIGNGIAGTTCARHLRKRDAQLKITLISSETAHFFSRPALMYIYMGHMTYKQSKPYEDSFWKKNNITCLMDHVKAIDTQAHTLELLGHSETLAYDVLVLATGSQSLMLDWPNKNLRGVQGLYSYQDLEQMQQSTAKGVQEAVVVGGGLIGIELAEMLHAARIKVNFLVREEGFWRNVLPKEEAALVGKHIADQAGVRMLINKELQAFEGNASGQVEAVLCADGSRYSCQFAAVAIGVRPHCALAKASGIETNKGILVDKYLQTSVSDIYAIGDCAQLREAPAHRRAVEAVWYVGRMMGTHVAKVLLGSKEAYQPGMWFNSAKFFDMEYQTYGEVPAQARPDRHSLYWQDTPRRRAIRIVFDAERRVVGCHALGIRQRHEIWQQWIGQSFKLDEVLLQLEEAGFDPEFSPRYAEALRTTARPYLSSVHGLELK